MRATAGASSTGDADEFPLPAAFAGLPVADSAASSLVALVSGSETDTAGLETQSVQSRQTVQEIQSRQEPQRAQVSLGQPDDTDRRGESAQEQPRDPETGQFLPKDER